MFHVTLHLFLGKRVFSFFFVDSQVLKESFHTVFAALYLIFKALYVAYLARTSIFFYTCSSLARTSQFFFNLGKEIKNMKKTPV